MKRAVLFGIIAAILVAVWWALSREDQSNPRKALGCTVTLKGAKRLPSGDVYVEWEIKYPRDPKKLGDFVQSESKVTDDSGKAFPWGSTVSWVTGSPAPKGWQRNVFSYYVKVPRDVDHVQVSTSFHYDRPNKQIHASIPLLPVSARLNSAKAGRCTFTALDVRLNTIVPAKICLRGGKTECMVRLQSQGPGSFNGCCLLSLDDGAGNEYSCEGYQVGPSSSSASMPDSVQYPNPAERLVQFVNASQAEKMHQQRVSRWRDSHQSLTEENTYFFPEIKPLPKKLTLKIRGAYDPDPSDQAVVVFRGVPITK